MISIPKLFLKLSSKVLSSVHKPLSIFLAFYDILLMNVKGILLRAQHRAAHIETLYWGNSSDR